MAVGNARVATKSNEQMFSNAPAKAPESGAPQTVLQWVGGIEAVLKRDIPTLKDALPPSLSPQRFMANALIYLRGREDLWGIPASLLMPQLLRAAQWGLDFGVPNEVHIVAFRNNRKGGRLEPTAVKGYKGVMKMARRGDHSPFLDVNVVREGDEFDINLGDGSPITHKFKFASRGKIVGAYATAKDSEGRYLHFVISSDEAIEHYKRFTKAKTNGPFAGIDVKGVDQENFEPYILKVAITMLCTRKLDLNNEAAEAAADEYTGGSILDITEDDPPAVARIESPEEEQPKEEAKNGPDKDSAKPAANTEAPKPDVLHPGTGPDASAAG